MGDTRDHRQLLAIMFTDVVGYTALTERDEATAVRVRTQHRDLVRLFLSFDATGALDKEQWLREAAEYLHIAMAPPTDTAARFLKRRLDHQHRWEVTSRLFAHIADAVFGVAGWTLPPSGSSRRGGRISARVRQRARQL